MDKLAKQLRQDADKIEVAVSDELDYRISASLRGISPLDAPAAKAPPQRPAMFWWASSLTGVVAAAIVIVIVNLSQPEPAVTPAPGAIAAVVPDIDWKPESAVFTGPLQQELDALQSDLKRAEERVRADIGL
ncbi:MAG: hypothetical protein WBN07_09000 [Woeseiaceae bacterium]